MFSRASKWALATCLLLLLLCICALPVHSQLSVDDLNDDTDAADSQLHSLPAGPAPPRTLLFRPAFDPSVPTGSAALPFPSSGVRALKSPFPLHVSLDALAPAARFRFSLMPSVPIGASVVGWDWRRNNTVGTLKAPSSAGAARYDVSWSETLPPWLQVIIPSVASTPSAASASVAPPDPNVLTLQLTVPQSGNRSSVYAAPTPVLLHFVGIVQYTCPPPLRPDDEQSDAAIMPIDPSDISNVADSVDTGSGGGSNSGSSATPLVLIAEVLHLSLLVSLSVTPPFAQRQTDLAPFYTLAATPNLLLPRNRLANRRGSAHAKTQGLGTLKFDWRDEIVYGCLRAQGKECAICTGASEKESASSSVTSSASAFPAASCAFPAGSFVNVAEGTLRVAAPIALLGLVQINAGAVLEFDHDTPSSSAPAGSDERLQVGVSVVDCREQSGQASPLVNEGLIIIRRGHVVMYSALRGHGAIHVHAGGSIEFVALQAHSSAASAFAGSGSGGSSSGPYTQQNIVYFNRTLVAPASNDLGGIAFEEETQLSSGGARRLLQVDAEILNTASEFTDSTTSEFTDSTSASIETLSVSAAFEIIAAAGNGTNATVAVDDVLVAPTSTPPSTDATMNSSVTAAPDSSPTSSANETQPFSTETPTTVAPSTSNVSNSSSTVKPPRPTPPAGPSTFVPHPSSALVLFGGGVLFSHGQFAFVAPFQSSRFAQGTASVAAEANPAANRIVLARSARVSFEAVPAGVALLGLNFSVTSANATHSPATLPPEHLISVAHLVNSGVLRAARNSRLNFSSLLFFRSTGLLVLEPGSTTLLELSDDGTRNVMDGIDGRRGAAPDDEERARLTQALTFIAASASTDSDSWAPEEPETVVPENPEASSSEQTVAEATAPATDFSAPAELSTSLSSLQTALSASSASLAVRPASGGVGLLLAGGTCLVRGGRLRFSGGFIARDEAHLFLKKGARWTVDVEPVVTAAWGVPNNDVSTSALLKDGVASTASSSVSYLHVSCVEFSLDGVLLLQSGHLELLTPLLQIEGHGQLVASGRSASLLFDTRRVNRRILAAQAAAAMGQTDLVPDAPPDSVLVENPDALEDPSADLYSLQPANATSTNDAAAEAPVVPALRENLIAPCLTSLACHSLQLTDGARVQVAPLTFLHLLPRARAYVSSMVLEGGALVLDSGAVYSGRALVANVSDASSFDANMAGGAGGPLSLPAVHVGNGSKLILQDSEEPLAMPPSAAGPWTPSNVDAPVSGVTQTSPALCALLLGNLTGNGEITCADVSGAGHRTVNLDALLLYPTFRSPSPFSPTVYVAPLASAPTATKPIAAGPSPLLAPMLTFGCNVAMTPRTVTQLDVLGYHSISSLDIGGTALLGGALVLNASTHVWPFDSTLGRSLFSLRSSAAALRAWLTGGDSKGMELGNPASAAGDSSVDDVTVSNSSSSTADTNNSTSSDNSTAAASPDIPRMPGQDVVSLLQARAGFLPLTNPAHFAQIQLASLYEVLPPGYTLDLEYVRTNVEGHVSMVPEGGALVAETTLWLKAYGAAYTPPRTAHANDTTSVAEAVRSRGAFSRALPAAVALALVLSRLW